MKFQCGVTDNIDPYSLHSCNALPREGRVTISLSFIERENRVCTQTLQYFKYKHGLNLAERKHFRYNRYSRLRRKTTLDSNTISPASGYNFGEHQENQYQNYIQVFQNKVLRKIVNSSWNVRNGNIDKELKMDTDHGFIRISAVKRKRRLHNHDISVLEMLDNRNGVRRLERTKPWEDQVQ